MDCLLFMSGLNLDEMNDESWKRQNPGVKLKIYWNIANSWVDLKAISDLDTTVRVRGWILTFHLFEKKFLIQWAQQFRALMANLLTNQLSYWSGSFIDQARVNFLNIIVCSPCQTVAKMIFRIWYPLHHSRFLVLSYILDVLSLQNISQLLQIHQRLPPVIIPLITRALLQN